ncbi:MAG: hypothetical protein A2W91_01450 [Bacteroidetes bacterium GWF2_38_335]|nr:MAG: hypothetical protein A2W91_01450 [Bacteroidetes bacterium GWF2_38_335]HBS85128.1 hypothetical protein [Bacteroidales bacterium]
MGLIWSVKPQAPTPKQKEPKEPFEQKEQKEQKEPTPNPKPETRNPKPETPKLQTVFTDQFPPFTDFFFLCFNSGCNFGSEF